MLKGGGGGEGLRSRRCLGFLLHPVCLRVGCIRCWCVGCGSHWERKNDMPCCLSITFDTLHAHTYSAKMTSNVLVHLCVCIRLFVLMLCSARVCLCVVEIAHCDRSLWC